MWYVIRVTSGREEESLLFMRKIIDLDGIGRAFIPKVTRKRKYKDGWHDVLYAMVPGYIFFETEVPEKLFFELKRVPKRTDLLRMDEDILSVSKNEESFIRELLDPEDVVAVSTAHKEGDKVIIDKGPLAGKESRIKNIDLHKRKAVITTEMFGRMMEFTVGLELLPQM